ncbi:DUF5009 domain-containing protein [Floridanema evergladense]|uniref:DUF5009 domain-containing protein n=1 Tax=Floridaenema evergladense BLCC-F167 TaxID=3153639 RepID=A0ABV4WS71_9CYAN
MNSNSISEQKRAYSLDALRGFAVLTMVLSGTISYRILPAWMYHAQEPPPTHTYNPNLSGLTWVDLVFPLFLFAMGASIPLALSRRIKSGIANKFKLILYILKRGFFLGAFAIFLEHFRPTKIADNSVPNKWLIALIGFVILFFMFVRLPSNWRRIPQPATTIGAWILAVIVISGINYTNGTGFSLARSDIILIVLTNTAVFGSIIWLFTRFNLKLRSGILGLLFALRLSSTVAKSWTAALWSFSPAPWIFKFHYLSYLFIVIPGTIAGDLILDWLEKPKLDNDWNRKSNYKLVAIIFLLLTNILVLLIGLQARWVWQTTLVSAVICCLTGFLFIKPKNETEILIQKLYYWGVYWLVLGLLFEPYQGGIKKDSATYSYFFLTTGIAFFTLIIFTILIDVFQLQKPLHLLIDNGQNPMIGYVGFANLVWPVFIALGIEKFVTANVQTPLHGFLKGVFYTLTVGYIVCLFTRFKLFWRT